MKLQIFDTNGTELKIGDLVQVQHSRNYDLTFFTRVQVIKGKIFPFSHMSLDRAFKIDKIPENCSYCPASEKSGKFMPEYWINKKLELKLIEDNKVEEWRDDMVIFDRNSFYSVSE